MDDYVAVEAYDVMLASTYSTSGSTEEAGHGSTTAGSATASWDLATGVTGKGWTLKYFNYATFSLADYDVYGTTDEEIRAKVIPYLNANGGSYVNSIGCA